MSTRDPVTPVVEWSDQSWATAAACLDADPGLFYTPEGRESDPTRERKAKAICRGCSVEAACLAWALEVDDQWAVLGGTTPGERKRMQRKARRAPRRSARCATCRRPMSTGSRTARTVAQASATECLPCWTLARSGFRATRPSERVS